MVVNSIHQLIKGRFLVATTPDDTVRSACTLLDRADIGALAVLDRRRLVGVLSERDVVRRCVCAGRPTAVTRVRDVMTRDPVTIPLKSSLTAAQSLMEQGGFRHLPVVDSTGDCVGMISMRDIPTEYRLIAERVREQRTPAPM